MLTTLPRRLRGLPTPMAGLALGVASLGWCMENALPLNGWGQLIGAFTASALLLLLVLRFVLHTETLWEDLKHPVVGSIVPTFAMSLMVISRALLHAFPTFAAGLKGTRCTSIRDVRVYDFILCLNLHACLSMGMPEYSSKNL